VGQFDRDEVSDRQQDSAQIDGEQRFHPCLLRQSSNFPYCLLAAIERDGQTGRKVD
jgi:hypothetical protein